MVSDKPMGKTSLYEEGAFAGTKGKMEKNAGNSGGLKGCCDHAPVLSTGEATRQISSVLGPSLQGRH